MATLRTLPTCVATSLLWLALAASSGAQDPAPFGLDERPSNTTCLAWDRPSAGASVSFQRVYDQVFSTNGVSNLTLLIQAPNDSSEWIFATRNGLVGRFENVPGVTDWSEMMDISGPLTTPPDGGLIGLAFHPATPPTPVSS